MKKLIPAAMLGVCMCGQVMADGTWAEKVRVKGDIRYRHEIIDQDGKDSRTRQRVRARAEIAATISEELSAAIKVASGSDDPVSSNQTLDNGFTSKGINLDKAYFDWHPAATPGLSIIGGKMSKPWVMVKDLVWDGDLNPEGLAALYTCEMNGITLMANAGGFWLDERKADDDTMLYSGQLAMEMKPGGAKVLVGGSLYSFDNMEGFTTLVDSEDGFGNTVIEEVGADGEVESLAYANEFEEVEGFVAISAKAGDVPVKCYGNYVVNNDADEDDTGYLVGVKVGKAKDPGTFELDYNYRELERDAVVGAFSDSDSFGGGTDGKGHKVSGKYQIAKNWKFGAAYFINELGLDGESTDYNRLQVDLIAKF